MRDAYLRWRVEQERQDRHENREALVNQVPLMEICRAYLDHCKANDSVSTYSARHPVLFDFCTGFGPSLRNQTPEQIESAEREAQKKGKTLRIHKGYGAVMVADLTKADVSQWLAYHPNWSPTGRQRIAVQALKRAINWAVEFMHSRITSNPIKGYKVKKGRKRITYFTPEIEQGFYEHARTNLALALKICIRTGARFGCEFAKLTAKEVQDLGDNRMQWVWPDGTKVRGVPRTIRITDQEIIEEVRKRKQRYSAGPLFRNSQDKPWTPQSLSDAFRRLRERMEANGFRFGDDDCMYTTRHTFAKRTLSGYWSRTPCTIEQLAPLMGDTREVCWDHYAQWCDNYTEPLWDALG